MTDTAAISSLLDDYIAWQFDDNPIMASMLGAEGFDDELGDFSAAGFLAREAGRDRWLERFQAVGTALDLDDGIDRDLVLAMLRGERVEADLPAWRRDPGAYLAPVFAALSTPFLHRLRREPELAASMVARLRRVPGVLAACRANLDPELASPLVVRRALGQALAGRGYLTRSLPAEVTDESLRAELAAAAEPAAEAFDALAAFLTDLAERATGDWRLGERRYSALLRQREMLGIDAAELHRRGQDAWAVLDAEMSELAADVDAGCGDWRTVIDRLSDDPSADAGGDARGLRGGDPAGPQVPGGQRAGVFACGETYRVVPSPQFQRPILAVAFYLAPPPLTDSRLGHFFVPYTPDGSSDEQVRERLRSNSRPQMPTTSVHEAYPGHHWHLSWMAGTPRTVRVIHRSAYFAEGWGLYAEKLMREQGYFTTPEHELAHLEARIFRASRIVVDTALHTGDMTVEQAEEFMSTKGTLNPETARAEVNRYCAWPTHAPSCLTGSLEIERIRADYLDAGLGGLREFHDRLAGSGSPDPARYRSGWPGAPCWDDAGRMTAMRAIQVSKHGGPEVLQLVELDDPEPGEGELLVRVAASGVNFVDVYKRAGQYPTPTPFVPGEEGAGTVLAVGPGVTEFAEGDRVGWCGVLGSYAELAVVPAAVAVAVLDGLDERLAAAALVQGMTAHYLTTSSYPVRRGDTVLVHAAAGGTGLLITQLAKARGGRVIGTVSSQAKEEQARAAGADEIVRYTEVDDVAARVRELTGGDGVAGGYDGVGRDTFDASLASLRRRGTLVVFGASSGPVPPVDLQRLNAAGSVFLTRPKLADHVATRDELTWRASEVFSAVRDGTLKIVIGGTYTLADASRAHEDLQSRRTTGKLLIVP